MKRLVVVVSIIFGFLFSVYSADIIAEGFGKTIEEAKSNALNSLAESIFTVLVSNTTSVSSSETESHFSSESTSSVFGELSFVDYESISLTTAQKKQYKYGYKAILRDNASTIEYYAGEAEQSRKNVEYYYGQTIGASDEVKSDYYREVLANYKIYNDYRMILFKLGHADRVPEIKIDKTENILREEYYSALNEQQNYYYEKLKQNNEMTSEMVMALIDKNNEEQKQAQKEKEEALLQEQLLRDQMLEEQINKYLNTTVGKTTVISGTSINDLESLFYNLVYSISEFNSICEQYDKTLSEQNKAIDKEIAEESAAIKNKTYRIGQLSNGKPLAEAIKKREEEVSEMKKNKEAERASRIAIIEGLMQPRIQESYDLIVSIVTKLEGTDFSDSVSRGSLSVSAESYDGLDFSWGITVKSSIINSFVIDTKLYYSDITGIKTVKDINDKDYNDNLEVYQKLLMSRDFWKVNDIEVHFSVKVTQAGYQLTIKSFSFIINREQHYRDELKGKNMVLPSKFNLKDVSEYKWLKTSPKLDFLIVKVNKETTKSTSTTGSNTTSSNSSTTWTTSSTNKESKNKDSSSSTSKFLDFRANIGLTISMKKNNSSSGSESQSNKGKSVGFLASFDCYHSFGKGFFGLGISPFFCAAGQKQYLAGADLLLVFDWSNLASSPILFFYSDLRMGFGKKGLNLTTTLIGMNLSSFSVGFGVVANTGLKDPMYFVNAGLKF